MEPCAGQCQNTPVVLKRISVPINFPPEIFTAGNIHRQDVNEIEDRGSWIEDEKAPKPRS
ncbi:MAG: hypothetical protein J0M04_10840 [Verrucomicrobia bacterium]|nr:hypothetical protein [Verrucomicrobiota bacterium]